MRATREAIEELGNRLFADLRDAGCDEALATRICFATGQRHAMLDGGDEFTLYRSALERYYQGDWDEPGPDLARRLMKEKFGDQPDPVQLLNWLIRKAKDVA